MPSHHHQSRQRLGGPVAHVIMHENTPYGPYLTKRGAEKVLANLGYAKLSKEQQEKREDSADHILVVGGKELAATRVLLIISPDKLIGKK